ncbi:MAG: WD40 repeat domain-containing protein, partial [Parafilimonas sp.]
MKKILSFFSVLIIAKISFGQKAELRIPIGHTSPIQAISISPDEKYAATASSDKSIKIWSIADGRQIKTLQMAERAWYQVKFIADNRHITVRLENGWEYWDALDGKKEYEFLDPATDLDSKKSFAISTDGTKVCVTDNTTVEIKNAADGKVVNSFNWTVKEGTTANFNEIRFNENYLGCFNKNELTLYNIKTKSKILLALPDDVTNSIDLAPDNNELYVNAQNHVYKINLDTKKITIIQDFGASEGSNFSTDGKYYIVADLSLIDRSTNEQVKHFYLDGMYSSTASSKYFVCFSRSTGNGELYSMKTFEKIRDFSNETAWLQQMTVNYKSNELVFTTDNKEARFWSLKNFNFEKTINLDPGNIVSKPDNIYSKFSQQGNYYLSSNFTKKSIINYYTGELLYNSQRNILDISPDGKIGFVEESGDGEIIDIGTGAVIKKIDGKYPRYFVSPDNKTVVIQHYPKAEINIYNYRNNTGINAAVQVGEYPKFSVDGSKLYSLGFTYDNTNSALNFLITSINTGNNISTTPVTKIDGMKMVTFAVSLDEKMVSVVYQNLEEYTMTNNNIIITYEVGTGKEISRLNNVSGGNDLIFLDEKYNLAALSMITNTVEIFNPVSQRHLIDITHFKGINDWIAVTPDGLYDGNMESLKKFYFVKGNEIVDPEAYFEKFYIPNLFARVMAGEEFAPVEINIKSAPLVKIQYGEKQRNLTVDDDVPDARGVFDVQPPRERQEVGVAHVARGDRVGHAADGVKLLGVDRFDHGLGIEAGIVLDQVVLARLRARSHAEGRAVHEAEVRVVEGIFQRAHRAGLPLFVELVDGAPAGCVELGHRRDIGDRVFQRHPCIAVARGAVVGRGLVVGRDLAVGLVLRDADHLA